MASKVKPEINLSDLVELLVHVPPRGKRRAIVTMTSETGPVRYDIDLDETLLSKILSLILSSGKALP